MTIGELAKRSGLTQSRIRFYERVGLLKTVERRANGYRTYPPEAAQVLGLIATAQTAGFSLDEIRGLLPSNLDKWDHDALLGKLRSKVSEIEAMEARLAHTKAQMLALIVDIQAKPDDLDCAANARRVLSRLQGGQFDDPPEEAQEARAIRQSKRRPKQTG